MAESTPQFTPRAAINPRADAARRLADLSPEELLANYAAGQEEAFSELARVIGSRLFAFIRRFLGDHHAAEDAWQAVLIKIAKNAHKFDGRAGLNAWVYRIARNTCLDAVRKRNRQRTVSLDQPPRGAATAGTLADSLVAGTPEPGTKLTVEELGTRIAEAVATLPEEQKEVFLLKEEATLTFEEIGELIGCGKETTKSRFRYALQRLRNALGAEARLFGIQES